MKTSTLPESTVKLINQTMTKIALGVFIFLACLVLITGFYKTSDPRALTGALLLALASAAFFAAAVGHAMTAFLTKN